MRAYVGKTGMTRMGFELDKCGVGEAIQRGEFPPSRTRHGWFFDNKAFSDWQNGRPFDAAAWLRDVESIREEGPTPDFLVLPDRVGEATSLEFSTSWIPKVRGVAPLALVVQNGMDEHAVASAIVRHDIAVLFVGGTLEWKFETGAAWVRLAHSLGRLCHIGRIGTAPRVRWAREIGADSIDSCTPLWSFDNLRRFRTALIAPMQTSTEAPRAPKIREMKWTKAKDRRLAREEKAEVDAVVEPIQRRLL